MLPRSTLVIFLRRQWIGSRKAWWFQRQRCVSLVLLLRVPKLNRTGCVWLTSLPWFTDPVNVKQYRCCFVAYPPLIRWSGAGLLGCVSVVSWTNSLCWQEMGGCCGWCATRYVSVFFLIEVGWSALCIRGFALRVCVVSKCIIQRTIHRWRTHACAWDWDWANLQMMCRSD